MVILTDFIPLFENHNFFQVIPPGSFKDHGRIRGDGDPHCYQGDVAHYLRLTVKSKENTLVAHITAGVEIQLLTAIVIYASTFV